MGEYTLPASTIVKMLHAALRGHTLERIARETVTDKAVVAATIAAHGQPSAREIKSNIEALEPLGDLTVTFSGKGQAPRAAAEPDGIESLLAQGESSDRRSIRSAALRIRGHLDSLRTALDADAQDAKRRARIKALRAELAELQRPHRRIGAATCTQCGFGAASDNGLAVHVARKHGKS